MQLQVIESNLVTIYSMITEDMKHFVFQYFVNSFILKDATNPLS